MNNSLRKLISSGVMGSLAGTVFLSGSAASAYTDYSRLNPLNFGYMWGLTDKSKKDGKNVAECIDMLKKKNFAISAKVEELTSDGADYLVSEILALGSTGLEIESEKFSSWKPPSNVADWFIKNAGQPVVEAIFRKAALRSFEEFYNKLSSGEGKKKFLGALGDEVLAKVLVDYPHLIINAVGSKQDFGDRCRLLAGFFNKSKLSVFKEYYPQWRGKYSVNLLGELSAEKVASIVEDDPKFLVDDISKLLGVDGSKRFVQGVFRKVSSDKFKAFFDSLPSKESKKAFLKENDVLTLGRVYRDYPEVFVKDYPELVRAISDTSWSSIEGKDVTVGDRFDALKKDLGSYAGGDPHVSFTQYVGEDIDKKLAGFSSAEKNLKKLQGEVSSFYKALVEFLGGGVDAFPDFTSLLGKDDDAKLKEILGRVKDVSAENSARTQLINEILNYGKTGKISGDFSSVLGKEDENALSGLLDKVNKYKVLEENYGTLKKWGEDLTRDILDYDKNSTIGNYTSLLGEDGDTKLKEMLAKGKKDFAENSARTRLIDEILNYIKSGKISGDFSSVLSEENKDALLKMLNKAKGYEGLETERDNLKESGNNLGKGILNYDKSSTIGNYTSLLGEDGDTKLKEMLAKGKKDFAENSARTRLIDEILNYIKSGKISGDFSSVLSEENKDALLKMLNKAKNYDNLETDRNKFKNRWTDFGSEILNYDKSSTISDYSSFLGGDKANNYLKNALEKAKNYNDLKAERDNLKESGNNLGKDILNYDKNSTIGNYTSLLGEDGDTKLKEMLAEGKKDFAANSARTRLIDEILNYIKSGKISGDFSSVLGKEDENALLKMLNKAKNYNDLKAERDNLKESGNNLGKDILNYDKNSTIGNYTSLLGEDGDTKLKEMLAEGKKRSADNSARTRLIDEILNYIKSGKISGDFSSVLGKEDENALLKMLNKAKNYDNLETDRNKFKNRWTDFGKEILNYDNNGSIGDYSSFLESSEANNYLKNALEKAKNYNDLKNERDDLETDRNKFKNRWTDFGSEILNYDNNGSISDYSSFLGGDEANNYLKNALEKAKNYNDLKNERDDLETDRNKFKNRWTDFGSEILNYDNNGTIGDYSSLLGKDGNEKLQGIFQRYRGNAGSSVKTYALIGTSLVAALSLWFNFKGWFGGAKVNKSSAVAGSEEEDQVDSKGDSNQEGVK